MTRCFVGVAAGLVLSGCVDAAGGVREYDPQEVQPGPADARVDDGYVRRGVEAAVRLDGVRALAEGGHEVVVESVLMTRPFDEECMVGAGEQPPEGCPVVTGTLAEEWEQSREQDAYVGQLSLRLDTPADPATELLTACPGLRDAGEVDGLAVHVLVLGTEAPGEDRAYVFSGDIGGQTVACGPASAPEDEPSGEAGEPTVGGGGGD